MKRFLLSLTGAIALCAPVAAGSASMMSPASVGVGAHGYDWLLGTWACVNSMPSQMSGPANTTLVFARTNAGTALSFHSTGTGFDQSGYLVYAPKTKTWWNPAAFGDGSYSDESSTDTGKTVVYNGSYFNAASGKTQQIRDTYTIVSATKQTDLGEYKTAAGAWKTLYKVTCTKG